MLGNRRILDSSFGTLGITENYWEEIMRTNGVVLVVFGAIAFCNHFGLSEEVIKYPAIGICAMIIGFIALLVDEYIIERK